MDNMIKTLFLFPETSSIFEDIELKYSKMNLQIEIYSVENRDKKYQFIFQKVIGFREHTGSFLTNIYKSCDKLVEIENSSWIKELKIHRSDKYKFFPSKNYAMYFENDGLFEVVSNNCKILIGEDTFEF